jgi:hypothetical protein
MMKKYIPVITLAFIVTLFVTGVALASSANDSSSPNIHSAPLALPEVQQAEPEGCLECHEGVEDIREPGSDMLKQIMAQGECTTCHGGDPAETEVAEAAHGPEGEFFPDPGSPNIVGKTCGKCHIDYGYALDLSLMNTEAGKIQGNLWAWGVHGEYGEERVVKYGNYTLDDEDGSEPIFGTDTYRAYMQALIDTYPDQMPSHMDQLPEPSVEEIVADPSLAAFTYLRNQCQRCHVGVPGRDRRADYRGMGCSSCHVPYGNEGLYEGGDPTIPRDEAGHLLQHVIIGTREARNGIPIETCNSCHNRGKRIGVSFEGIMEFPYGTPFTESGGKQPKMHTKQYLYIKDDLHHDPISREGNPDGGMFCQDCHTGIEMHGDGNLFGTTLAQVEIECSDCHGTPDIYPWDLPIGFGEELITGVPEDPRGTTTQLPTNMMDGTVYDVEDGYLLTSRGNPFGNVVRRGDDAIVHSATGRDYTVPTLKSIKDAATWKNVDAEVAMDKIAAHQDELECYACHADWAPQCYGCHVTADYSEEKTGMDWVAIGNSKAPDGTVDTSLVTPGNIAEGRSYLRWEEPILGINGEGRVTPIIPGCHVIYTVIGPDGANLAHNVIGRTLPGEEGGGPEGQVGLDMAPAQPHTVGREARRCESCHSNPKALGYGVEGGRFLLGYEEPRVIDLRDSEGNVIPENFQIQMSAIPDLPRDLSQVVDPETGQQVMTIGSHWPQSGPLTADQRERMERTGVCMGCHTEMADTAFWTDEVIAKYGTIVSNDDHIQVMNQVLKDAVTGVASAESAAEPDTAPEAAPDAAPDEVAALSAEAEAAMEQVQSLETDLADTKSALADARTELANSEATTSAMEAGISEDVDSGLSNAALYVILALIGGLLLGAGIMYLGKKS